MKPKREVQEPLEDKRLFRLKTKAVLHQQNLEAIRKIIYLKTELPSHIKLNPNSLVFTISCVVVKWKDTSGYLLLTNLNAFNSDSP
jgi:hypothetical protein